MTVNNLEKFRSKIESGTLCLGMVVWLTDPTVSEIAGDAGFDFTWIDTEHAALNIETVQEHIRAARGTELAPIVRVPWNDPVLIKPILDIAPAGVIIPMVNTGKEAERAVAACRYPPEGVRGCGVRRGTRYGAEPFDEYLDKSRNDPMIIVQIEHVNAVRNLDEILKVKGIDSICVGPSDLSASMGKLGDPAGKDEVEETIDLICEKARKAGVAIGSIGAPENLARWRQRGANWLAVMGDAGAVFASARSVINEMRDIETGTKSGGPY